MTRAKKMKAVLAWAILRDGVYWTGGMTSKRRAQRITGIVRPGSKHKWRIARVRITEARRG